MALNFNVDVKIATAWNQLTAMQLKEIALSLESFHSRPKLLQENPKYRQLLYYRLVRVLLSSNAWYKIFFALRQIPPETYKEPAKFLFKDCTRTAFLPPIKIKRVKFHPPADRLSNISIEEFSLADTLYVSYRRTNDVRYLNNLCATLYRRAGGNEIDSRMPFNKILIERDVKHFRKLDHKTKLAILYAYTGSRHAIAASHPHVFPKPVKSENPAATSKPSVYTPFGKLVQYKIKFDPYKLEQTLKLNAWSFIGNYENELAEAKKIKK